MIRLGEILRGRSFASTAETLGSQATGAWARERFIILRWQQTVWKVRSRSKTMDPLA
jgi:hypothetical protein